MGGKAIVNARRMSRQELDFLTGKVCGSLLTSFPELQVERLRSYKDKEDFGNLSLVVAKTTTTQDIAVRRQFLSLATGLARDFGDRVTLDIDGAQVDLAFVEKRDMEMYLSYHAYNGLGGLVGKVAHSMGLTLRETGLVYRIMDGDQLVEEILLTNYWQEAMRILGYSSVRWLQGFHSLEDIFDYVASGANFRAQLFHVAEKALPNERPTVVQLFSQWLQTASLLGERDAILRMLFQRVPGFESNYHEAITRIGRARTHKRTVHARFNGDLVAQWTGRSGRDLGALLKHITETFGGQAAVNDWVLATHASEIEKTVKHLHENLN